MEHWLHILKIKPVSEAAWNSASNIRYIYRVCMGVVYFPLDLNRLFGVLRMFPLKNLEDMF